MSARARSGPLGPPISWPHNRSPLGGLINLRERPLAQPADCWFEVSPCGRHLLQLFFGPPCPKGEPQDCIRATAREQHLSGTNRASINTSRRYANEPRHLWNGQEPAMMGRPAPVGRQQVSSKFVIPNAAPRPERKSIDLLSASSSSSCSSDSSRWPLRASSWTRVDDDGPADDGHLLLLLASLS